MSNITKEPQHPENPTTPLSRVAQSAMARIVIGLIVCILTIVLTQSAFGAVLNRAPMSGDLKRLIITLISVTATLLVYKTLYRVYEKRKITELNSSSLGIQLGAGIGLGFILQTLTIGVIYLLAEYSVTQVNGFSFILPALTISISSAIMEEILFRGIIYRITEQSLGSGLALLISALLFGAVHYTNPGSSFGTALGLALQAGILLGLSYTYTRSLWMPIGLHFAWNFTQSGIYGAKVSGIDVGKSILESEIVGPAFVTGGEFGPEGSVQATVFCLMVSVVLYYFSKKRGLWVKLGGELKTIQPV